MPDVGVKKMHRLLKVIASLWLLNSIAGDVAAPIAAESTKPTAKYWHLWTDKEGKTHMTQCSASNFALQRMNKPADPQWENRLAGNGKVIFTVQPVHWNGAWHENPKVQWVVPLEGTWFVEAQDGTRAEMGPGVVFLGEDQNSSPDSLGHKGHLAGNVGNGAVTLMVVQTDAAPTVGKPCHIE
jgi:hypothetical protein